MEVFIAGTVALEESLLQEMKEALAPKYTFSYHVECNDDCVEQLEKSDIAVAAATEKEEEEEGLQGRIAEGLRSVNPCITITAWDRTQGAGVLRFILDCMTDREYLKQHCTEEEPKEEKKPKYELCDEMKEQAELMNDVVYLEGGMIDIEATNRAIRKYGYRLTIYADGRESRMGYVFVKLNEEGKEEEEQECEEDEELEESIPHSQ